jgi:glycosyl transferase, family 25
MKAFVITILDNEKSVEYAKRAAKSAEENGFDAELFTAIVPGDELNDLIVKESIPVRLFYDEWCKYDRAIAAFMSHYSLWKKCIELDEPILILEHDAVVTGPLPDASKLGLVTNVATPSYGKFNTPLKLGLGPLVSKRYFPGAHGYVVKPEGAKRIVAAAEELAQPTDIYLNIENFPWLEEWYPWIVIAKDDFTTIQKERGCLAKHSYKKNPENYKVID